MLLPDQPADEILVSSYLAGDESALDQLYQRYYNPLGFFIRKHSLYKDDSFIGDCRQIAFFKVFTIFKEGRFKPELAGSFKTLLYKTAKNVCFDENEKRMRSARPLSEVFTREELATPEELCYRQPESTDYDEIQERVKQVLAKLTKKEQKLMWLVSEGKKCKDIIKMRPFSKEYKSVDSLKQKIYNIRKKFKKGGKDNDQEE